MIAFGRIIVAMLVFLLLLVGPSSSFIVTPTRSMSCYHHVHATTTKVITKGTATELRSTSSKNSSPFLYSPTSLKHLENTELPDDNSRPWTETKIKALASGLALGVIAGIVGEIIVQNLFDIEKSFAVFGSVGTGIGWYFGGGIQVAEDEKPINGGYDRKLIADRPARMASILDTLKDSGSEIEISPDGRDLNKARMYAAKVHTEEYLSTLQTMCEQADRPQRLNPLYARTLIDQHSFDAALNAVCDWMDSVDAALTPTSRPKFALVRPPSHHACKSKGMGGCLLNSVAIAAVYALEKPKVSSVAILDFDCHHGNGIAHCVQDIPAIRYCSIHEAASSGFLGREKDDPADPRSPASDDSGPLGNIMNINLPPKTSWGTGYKDALVNQALPFLTESNPDILLVAAGFDALDADLMGKLALQPEDFQSIAQILKEKFGNRVASGLEGGYCWQGGQLNQAIIEFTKPWN